MSVRSAYLNTEPVRLLRDGTRVLLAHYEMVEALLESGHTVEVFDGHVRVDPPIHPDALYTLEACPLDTSAIVAEPTEPFTVH